MQKNSMTGMNSNKTWAIARFKVTEDTVFREVDDTVIALNLNSGQYFTLNEVGSRMWAFIAEQLATDAIINTIVAEYDVTHQQVEKDLFDLLVELKANGLVEEVNQ